MTVIDDFLAQKDLSPNSLTAYHYDLEQFRQLVSGTIDGDSLRHYQHFLTGLKPSAQKRKLSAVNQFLYYLYQKQQVRTYYKLKLPLRAMPLPSVYKSLDLSLLKEETGDWEGQLIALLIAEMGLLPSELRALKSQAVNLDFKVITVVRGRDKRVLQIPDLLLPYLEGHLSGVYLFDKKGQTYSRQWFFNRLTAFLNQVGLADLTAQKLREQFILKQLAQGCQLTDLAKLLGIKSVVTLEKYLQREDDGYKN